MNINLFICEAAFTTLTNVNFDQQTLIEFINKSAKLREDLREKVRSAGGYVGFHGPVDMQLEKTEQGLITQGKQVGINADSANDPDLHGLHWLVIYGVKGVSAYAYHAFRLGKKDDRVFEFIQKGLAATLDKSLGVDDFFDLASKCGEINIRAMELLDAGNTETYGHPVPTQVPLGHKKGKAILVSGHDLKDLDEILKQAQGKSIYVYSHGEMLSSHGYPNLKKYRALSRPLWDRMAKSTKRIRGFSRGNSDDYQLPSEARRKLQRKLFTSGPVGWPGVTHIECSNTESVTFRLS